MRSAAPAHGGPSDAVDAVDAIFAQTAVSQTSVSQSSVSRASGAAGAIDAFVSATREPVRIGSAALRQARTAIEDSLFGSASDLLRSPAVARLESIWRSVKLIADAAADDGEVLVEALDLPADRAVRALESIADAPGFDRPDAIVVLDPIASIDHLSSWAGLGETILAPVIAALEPPALGEDLRVPERWEELRANESARWLCVATNRIVLAQEGAGTARRVVFGSAAAAVCAALIASFRKSGTFGQLLTPANALRAPSVWMLPSGHEAGSSSPLERFCSIGMQERLRELGLLALGAARNSDRVILTSAPTVRGSADAVPLPAQLLTGRIVRFASWCRDQLPSDTPADQIPAIFKDAADALLFPAARGTAALSAQLVEGGTTPQIVVRAVVLAAYGGTPFELEFGLSAPSDRSSPPATA